MSVFDFIRRAAKLHAEERAAEAKRKAWLDAAVAYNRLHAWTLDGRWMCPACHTIHKVTERSPWVGNMYPACCEFLAGDRHSTVYGAPLP